MGVAETFLALFALLGALAWLAPRLRVPYPVLLVLAGIGVAITPGVPRVALDPDAVFLIFVPPIVYYSAFFSSWRDLRANARLISLLAVPLVLVTMAGVAWLAHAMVGFAWAVAFTLGAILAPSDATAVIAVLRDVSLPRRLHTVLEGESLFNDPVAIVSYRMAVAAVVTGAFSWWDAGWRLVVVGVGGALAGLALGRALYELRRRIRNPDVEVVASLLTPYVAYLAAERVGVSGVVATLATGMLLGWLLPSETDAETRLQTQGAWGTFVFFLNGLVFILLGMALPAVVARLDPAVLPRLVGVGVAIAALCVVVRALGILSNICWSCVRAHRRDVPWGEVAIAAWSGMRGVDSLVTSLALPLVVAAGTPFPHRDALIVVTSTVIVVTLGVQGLTLPWLARRLHVEADGEASEQEAARARFKATRAALEVLERHLSSASPRERPYLENLKADYQHRLERYQRVGAGEPDPALEALSDLYHKALREAVNVERATILMLRNEGEISNDVMHALEHELDLKETLHRTD